MEQIKLLDKYIERLSTIDLMEEQEQKLLIEEVTRVVFNQDELIYLALSYYRPYIEPNYKKDAIKLKAKLELKKAQLVDDEYREKRLFEMKKMELENLQIQEEMKKSNVVINNHNHNESISSASVSVSFEEVRKNIDNMTSLPEIEIEEIKNQIDEIEKIVNSKEPKAKKWSKAKDIVKWLADKGVDVGIALLPLILKIN